MVWSNSAGYALHRLVQAVPTVLVIVALNFMLLQLAPGDAADVLAGEAGSATPEFMAQLRQKFGLDQPVAVQLLLYMKNIVSFDLGFSFRHNMPVARRCCSCSPCSRCRLRQARCSAAWRRGI